MNVNAGLRQSPKPTTFSGCPEIYADENGALTDLEFHIKEIYDHKDDPLGYPQIIASTDSGL